MAIGWAMQVVASPIVEERFFMKESFNSKIGAIFVAAGSAIGLGSIWRFPYIAGENGGGAFILVYLLSMLVVGIPVMLAEFAVGTHTRKNPVKAYEQLSPKWRWLGYNSVLVSSLISGFYYIVAGWSLAYFVASIDGSLYAQGVDLHQFFEGFTASWQEAFYMVLFILLTHIIVAMGVQSGLERISKIVMPILLLILFLMVGRSAMMTGSTEGFTFLFKPDWDKVMSVDTIISGIGQAFFSLSSGLGCMIAYASYFKKGTNLVNTSVMVAGMTFLVAVLSGMVIFPAVFSVEGLEPAAGPTLIFETLPFVFRDMPLPQLWSSIFFLLIALAALTSTISFHEVMTQFLQENYGVKRQAAATYVSLWSLTLSLLCLYVPALFDGFDSLSANVLMPLGGLLTAIFAGWVFDYDIFRREIGGKRRFYVVLHFLLKWVCPTLLLTTFIYNLMD